MSLFVSNGDGQHRAKRRVVMAAHPMQFVPRHCAGTSCMHSHPGEDQLPTFRGWAS